MADGGLEISWKQFLLPKSITEIVKFDKGLNKVFLAFCILACKIFKNFLARYLYQCIFLKNPFDEGTIELYFILS